MRGRKPKPTQRQIAEGDPRKRGVNKLDQKLAAEPKAARGLPACPRHLRGRARAAWNLWKEELEGMGQDFRPDAMMLEGACVNYARAVQADLILSHGCQVEEPILDRNSGKIIGQKVKNHPVVAVSNACWRNVRAFCSEFGLSPVSRTRLAIEKTDSSDLELMELLFRSRQLKSVPELQ